MKLFALSLCMVWCLDSSAVEIRYQVVLLEATSNTNYYATDGYTINDSGVVAGQVTRQPWARYPSGNMIGLFIHSDEEGFREIGDYQGARTQPLRMNNSGVITIYALGYESNGVWIVGERAIRYSPAAGFENLGGIGGTHTRAMGINSRGDIVGRAYTTGDVAHAFVYREATGLVDLGLMGGTYAATIDINDQGWMSGVVVFPGQGNTAFLYHEQQGLTLLGHGRGLRVNEQKVVLCDDDSGDPVLIKDGQTIPVRGANNVFPTVCGCDLNDWNVVVGTAYSNQQYAVGYVWTEAGGLKNLNTLIPPNSGWWIGDALAINNRGQITGVGGYNGKYQAYRLDPIAPKPSIRLSGANVVVSWSPPYTNVVLEASTSLSSPSWTPIPRGTNTTVTVPTLNQSRFFRLNLDALRGLCCAPE